MTYFSNFGTPNISGTSKGTNLKFCTWIEGKGPDTKQKCKTGQNESWPRSRATSRSHDLLNKQPTEALRNGKIRESTHLTSNTVTECRLRLLTSWTKKQTLI